MARSAGSTAEASCLKGLPADACAKIAALAVSNLGDLRRCYVCITGGSIRTRLSAMKLKAAISGRLSATLVYESMREVAPGCFNVRFVDHDPEENFGT
jgi:hypothetical protein